MEKYLEYMGQKHSRRIFQLLQMLEQYQNDFPKENSPFTDSLLSLEIKHYFSRKSKQPLCDFDPEGQMPTRLYHMFSLDPFEVMCIELALLGDVNPYVEKFFIYMNNDWNCRYLTMDTAICLFTMKTEAEAIYYRYLQENSALWRFFLKISPAEGKGRGRWGISCRNAFFSFLFVPETYTLPDAFRREEPACGGIFCPPPEGILPEGGQGIYYLYGVGLREQLDLVTQYCRQQKHDLIRCDMNALMQQKEAGIQKQNCQDALMQILYRNAWLCVSYLDRKFWEEESGRELLVWLQKEPFLAGTRVFLLGETASWQVREMDGIWEIPLDRKWFYAGISDWRRLAEPYAWESSVDLAVLSSTYRFTGRQVAHLLRNADRRRQRDRRHEISGKDLTESCIAETDGGRSGLLSVRDTKACWEDLVLPEHQMTQLRSACSRIRYKQTVFGKWGFDAKFPYGRGVSMMFSGPPGTGKTMAAGVMANSLGTSLYCVELASVVSKYIGETEKNLKMVFENAAEGQGVLFFDEADALFGRRTEVKDSHDKHSNMEAAYLLQKMEEYEGVVILATNYKKNMDEAFGRRISYEIEFPFPDEACRRQLWRKSFPERMEWEEEPDYPFLAKQFKLSGSQIKNIALQTAFYAAEEGRGGSMEQIIRAALTEIKKTGKKISGRELQEYAFYQDKLL